jgi:MFS family permease
MSNLNVTKSEIGLVATMASFVYGTTALVGGPLGDKIGESKTIVLSLGLSGLAALAMIPAQATGSIFVYALVLIMMAVWGGLYHPTANSLISKTFKGRVSESMGLHGVGGTLGVVLTPTIAWFIGSTYGWSWAFATFGALCVLFALLFMKSFGKTEKETTKGGTILGALRIRELWTLLIFNVAIGLFMKGVELFFPLYVSNNKLIHLGLSSEERGMWSSIAYTLVLATGVPAQWIGGKAADKFGSKRVLIATSIGVCLSFLFLLLLPAPFSIVGIGVFIVLYGLSFYAHQPAMNALTSFCCPPNQRGAVFGIFFFTSFGIGSVSQVIAGYVGDVYGLDVAFYLLTAFAICALVLSPLLPKRREVG